MPKLSTAITRRDIRQGKFCLKKDTNRPVRTSVKRTFGRVDGYFPSKKNNRMIAWESQIESRACHYFEFIPSIKRFVEQPVRIEIGNSEKFSYTPDFKVVSNTATTFVEIKPAHKLLDFGLRKKLERITFFFEEFDCNFVIITDEEVPKDLKFNNIKRLLPFAAESVLTEHVDACLKATEAGEKTKLSDFLEIENQPRSLMAMLAQHIITTDFNIPITLDSFIKTNRENQYENALLQCRTAPDFKQRPLHHFLNRFCA